MSAPPAILRGLSPVPAGIILSVALSGCAAPDPQLSFLDTDSGLSFIHAPRWSVGFAEQDGLRYRYLTAPKVENDTTPLSVTLIAPSAAASPDEAAVDYLAGASGVSQKPASSGGVEWSFRDSSSVPSRLRIKAAGDGRFFGAWARGSEAALNRYSARLDGLFASLTLEIPEKWPEERFGGMTARVPSSWTRASRLSNDSNATMQFRSLALAVDKGTDTIHGFVTLSKEPAPGGLDAYALALKERASDTVVLIQHQPWTPPGSSDPNAGYADFLRSGTTLSATRSRRWFTVHNQVALVLSCEARADAFDRLEPWCVRMAQTIRLD